MKKRIPCEFGRSVLNKLIETGMTQRELIEAVRTDTLQFFDGGYLYKVLTGQRNPPSIVSSICKILELEQPN